MDARLLVAPKILEHITRQCIDTKASSMLRLKCLKLATLFDRSQVSLVIHMRHFWRFFKQYFWVSGLILDYFEELFQASLWLVFLCQVQWCILYPQQSFTILFTSPFIVYTCCCTSLLLFFKFNMQDFSQTFLFSIFIVHSVTFIEKPLGEKEFSWCDDPNYLIKRGGKWDTNYTKNPSPQHPRTEQ